MEKYKVSPRRNNIIGLIIDNLYGFYFKDRKKQYSSYFFALLASTIYASINLIILERSENIVIFESVTIIFVILFVYPAIYCIHKLKNKKINYEISILHEQIINNYLLGRRDKRHALENMRRFFSTSMSEYEMKKLDQIHTPLYQLSWKWSIDQERNTWAIKAIQEMAIREKKYALPNLLFSAMSSAKIPLKDFNPTRTSAMRVPVELTPR